VGGDDERVLGGGEGAVAHVRAELVAPPQAARLARAPRDAGADEGPVAGPVLPDQRRQQLVLVGAPRPRLDRRRRPVVSFPTQAMAGIIGAEADCLC
jgi:hypothetical protein